MSDDSSSPLFRLKAALDGLDPRAAEILALHAAIERELDLSLRDCLPATHRLIGLGFRQKVSVWAAVQKADDRAIQAAIDVMTQFNEVRNEVAHPGPLHEHFRDHLTVDHSKEFVRARRVTAAELLTFIARRAEGRRLMPEEKPVSLAPLKLDQALSGLLQVKPPEKSKRKKKAPPPPKE
jgi:hypothetical protein